MQIRLATTHEDAVSASRIFAMSWKVAYRGIFSDTLLDTLALDRWVPVFEKGIEAGSPALAILSVAGADAAAISYGPAESSGPGEAELHALYALPAYWGGGVAARLLAHAVEALAADGMVSVRLFVAEPNARARRFYEKHGFAATGQTRRLETFGEAVQTLEYFRKL